MAYKAVTVDVDIDLEDFDTLELIEELQHRAKKNNDRDAAEALGQTYADLDEMWRDIEEALLRRDFDTIARWLWPQVKEKWPAHRYKELIAPPAPPAPKGKKRKARAA